MSRVTRRTPVTAVAAALVLVPGLGLLGPAASAADLDQDEPSSAASSYPGNTTTEPALVAQEEDRLSSVRTVASTIRWQGLGAGTPYRLSTGTTYTLVLTERAQPYGVADLLQLAPQTFVRQPDGGYLLTEHIVVHPGATLALAAPTPLTIRLASEPAGFVSIVNAGGTLAFQGTAKAPVSVTSWDSTAGAPDATTDDGRAYVRSIGGQVELVGSTFSALGFWSGRTGGVALTGSDQPSIGTLGGLEAAPPAPPAHASVAPADGAQAAPSAPAPAVPQAPAYSYVSATIKDSTFQRNAFGLFVSSANGVDISGSTVEDSIIDGLIMHRFVVNAAVDDTVSRRNAGHGIVLARATTGITLREVTSVQNRGSGIVVRGTPLADGPNATGMPVGDYGNNAVVDSVASDNGRYGIEVIGGENVRVEGNIVERNDMGIVVREGAAVVQVVRNRLADNTRHGIALRDGVLDSAVARNVVSRGPSGVYLRDSSAAVERNTLTELTHHAVTVVGSAEGTLVAGNTLTGRGPSAVDHKRAEGTTVGENDASGWTSTKPFWTMVRNALQPLTVMWILLALLVVVTALKGSTRHQEGRREPYGAQRRMADLVEAPVLTHRRAGAGRHADDRPAILVGRAELGDPRLTNGSVS